MQAFMDRNQYDGLDPARYLQPAHVVESTKVLQEMRNRMETVDEETQSSFKIIASDEVKVAKMFGENKNCVPIDQKYWDQLEAIQQNIQNGSEEKIETIKPSFDLCDEAPFMKGAAMIARGKVPFSAPANLLLHKDAIGLAFMEKPMQNMIGNLGHAPVWMQNMLELTQKTTTARDLLRIEKTVANETTLAQKFRMHREANVPEEDETFWKPLFETADTIMKTIRQKKSVPPKIVRPKKVRKKIEKKKVKKIQTASIKKTEEKSFWSSFFCC